jgi:GT2 family glycosyltransferase
MPPAAALGRDDVTPVRTTVIVPAYRAWRTLPRALEALRVEVDRPDRELVLVESSGLAADELERRWPWATIVALPERTLPGTARNLAVARARGDLIAFTDADAVPEPGWLDELEGRLGPGVDAVAGAIVNGTPDNAIGRTSGFLLEFADWLPERRGSPRHGATCNLLVRRSALVRAGGFPSDLWPGEDTVFTFGLGDAGRLAFAPAARVRHLNRTRLREYLGHQARLGFSFAEVCSRTDFPYRQYARMPFAPFTGVARVARLWSRLARWHALPRTPLLLPLALLGATAWAAGLTSGALRRSVHPR